MRAARRLLAGALLLTTPAAPLGRPASRAALPALPALPAPPAPPPALAVESGGAWREWWRADRAPARWPAALPVVANAVRWHPAAPGLEWGELRLSGSGEAWRIGVVLARFDPTQLRLDLAYTPDPLERPNRWDIGDAPADAVLAFNAGQFDGHGPWGWLVRDGVELGAPRTGPLAPAIVVDTAGALAFVPFDSLAARRARGGLRLAFQSYPAVLLDDGLVPDALRRAGAGVSLVHRDARLALGELRDGRWLVALTRFEGLGGALSNLPFGLTTPEMAALLGALGAGRAVLLDGGMSSQLLVRDTAGASHAWTGLRRVPLGLVAVPRR
ncbi:MAG TPA: phosphodiester glycosidase family protein [Gemmatimonadales bacterium]|nr:phosphodiester glycosidase family protein [Gemmatimonadales bacterium]